MATITRFEEIESWQLARRLTNQIYDLSDAGQFSRDFGLRDQMRRAAVYRGLNLQQLRKDVW